MNTILKGKGPIFTKVKCDSRLELLMNLWLSVRTFPHPPPPLPQSMLRFTDIKIKTTATRIRGTFVETDFDRMTGIELPTSSSQFRALRLPLLRYNHGQKCWEGNFILQIPPSPFSMLDFPGEKNDDFSYLKNSNIEYGGGGPQEHGISQILQPIVRKIELGVK